MEGGTWASQACSQLQEQQVKVSGLVFALSDWEPPQHTLGCLVIGLETGSLCSALTHNHVVPAESHGFCVSEVMFATQQSQGFVQCYLHTQVALAFTRSPFRGCLWGSTLGQALFQVSGTQQGGGQSPGLMQLA